MRFLTSSHSLTLCSRIVATDDDEGKPTKSCIGMYSRDGGEYVPFHKPCDCSGPVEVWLNLLMDAMRDTLRHILGEAVAPTAKCNGTMHIPLCFVLW